MVCPNCGAPLEDFDVFCPSCGKAIQKNPDGTLAAVDAPASTSEDAEKAPPKKVAKRLYPPEDAVSPVSQDAAPQSKPTTDSEINEKEPAVAPPDPKPVKLPASTANTVNTGMQPDPWRKRLIILSSCLVIFAAAAIALAVFFYLKTDGLQVQAQKAQMEKSAAETTLEDMQSQMDALDIKYQDALSERDDLSAQVDDLNGQIREMKSSVSQSEYDKTAAEKALEETQQEMTSLNDTVDDLNGQLTEAQSALETAQKNNEALQATNDTLTRENSAYQDEVGFYDTYVVFVMLGSDTKYYHKYDCKNFTKQNFLAYSTKLAEANGYSPCPICCSSN